jgi:hypothetical protein
MNKNYKSTPIPNRASLTKEQVVQKLRNTVDRIMNASGNTSINFEDYPFAQIDIADIPDKRDESGAFSPRAQTIRSDAPRDNIRIRFTEMRRLGNTAEYSNPCKAKTFYNQALFMKDFEDDYDGQSAFSSFFPNYQMMGYEHLRTYFTWRTQVRKGNITETSVSFAFLYIYELINNIGVEDAQDGLNKLTKFWKAFRIFNSDIDKYVLQWLKDYHVYYLPENSFRDYARQERIMLHYPAVFGYDTGKDDSFELFSEVSKYNIRESAFYSEQTHPVISDCFYFILNRLREEFAGRGKRFEDFAFYVIERETSWTPFNRALFYPVTVQPDRQVIVSEREIYTCRRNLWTYRTALLTDRGGALVGYVMKAMEVELRKKLKFKYKISANETSLDSETRGGLAELGISLPELIARSTADFYALYTRTEVRVSTQSLARIRKEALDTQGKLIIPEDDTPQAEEKVIRSAAVTEPNPGTDIWIQFRESLTQTELDALSLIMRGESFEAFAAEHGIMPEVLIDGINQKAADSIGDTIMEYDGAVSVYEDYTAKLTETADS